MGAYYLYRINTGYDGFLPSRIPARAKRNRLFYNWTSYVESLEPGDIILTYFTGSGCRTGVYAVAEIRTIDLTKREGNVVGRLLHYSDHNKSPLIPVAGNEGLFESIRTRRRGAEVVVPDGHEREIFRLLAKEGGAVAEARARNIELPGSDPLDSYALETVPLLKLHTQLSDELREKVVAAYWIRPHQASWIANPPRWLHVITRVFGKFKAGDFSRLDELADSLVQQIRTTITDVSRRVGLVVSVPLNARKTEDGEADRVGELARRVAARLRLPYTEAFELEGNVSRRLYKNCGFSEQKFKADYRNSLKVRHPKALSDSLESGRQVLLIDDVYTDGVTTRIVAGALKGAFEDREVDVLIATLGIMAKQNNMDSDLADRWR